MVKRYQRELALAGLLVALGLGIWLWGGSAAPQPAASGPASPSRARSARADAGALPRIDLDRLQRPRANAGAGQRSLFDFGQPPAPPQPPPPPPPTAAELEAAAKAAEEARKAQERQIAERVPAGPPPLNVRFVGALESKPGLRVAVLMTDRKEILTGQAGEVVANRLKIVAIGHESVDVQDVGSERVRRIPLKGN